MDKHSWLWIWLFYIMHQLIIQIDYLFVFVWISKSCPTLHIHTHMIPQLCQRRHGDTAVLTGSDKMDTEWGWGKRRAENESRCLEGGRGESERESGNGRDAPFEIQSPLLPHVCLLGYWLSTLLFLHQSLHPFTHTPNTHSHTLHSSDCLYIPCDRPYSALLLYCPSPSPFNIKPLTLCGKWAHSPIQCLLRHDVSEFYIKTDKAGLGCRSG